MNIRMENIADSTCVLSTITFICLVLNLWGLIPCLRLGKNREVDSSRVLSKEMKN